MKKTMSSIIAFFLLVCTLLSFGPAAFADGTAPVAENLELKTYKNTSVGGTLKAYDPDGDAESFEITTKPVKGSVVLNEDGSFVYTPEPKRGGRDYFGYKVTDAEGNVSQEATVIIRIEKGNGTPHYKDTVGRAGAYAAERLSKNGYFTGEKIGGEYCFFPDRAVTRGEFLSLCMMISDEPLICGVYSTGLDDDESIPDWMKSYVVTAAMSGIGNRNEIFNAEQPISRSEAALILSDCLGLDYLCDVFDDCTEETAACMALDAVGIIETAQLYGEELTREQAAIMLVKALDTLKATSHNTPAASAG